MPLIVTSFALPETALELLSEVGRVRGPEAWESHLSDAAALIALVNVPIDAALLRRAPALRIVANAAVGFDNIDLERCAEAGVVVTNTPGVLTDATADLTLGLILSCVRRLPQAEASLRAGEFRGWNFWDYLGGDIGGARLGIFGMGRIGHAVARRARGFGMEVQYHSRTRRPAEQEEAAGIRWVEWEELLTTSDILSLHAPSTPATRHLLDAAALRRMKPGSYLINTARGNLIDEGALVEVLREGRLAGAGLDVYEHEPDLHPGLLDLDSVTLLPHIGSATPNTRTAIAMLAARNVHAFLRGAGPLTPVR